VVVRLNSLDALHDLDADGLSLEQRQQLIETLGQQATVIVSDESGEMDLTGLDARAYDLHPGRIHDVLAEAELVVAETGTMVIESAFLGTPAIASSPFAEEGPGEFLALEKHGLIRSTTDYDTIVDCANHILAGDVQRAIPLDDGPADVDRRREVFTEDLVDLTALLTEIATSPDGSPNSPDLKPRSASHDDQADRNHVPTS
jgi:predicted glycosyltransferase